MIEITWPVTPSGVAGSFVPSQDSRGSIFRWVYAAIGALASSPIESALHFIEQSHCNCDTRDERARGPAFALKQREGVCYVRREKNLARRDGIVRCDCFGEHACYRATTAKTKHYFHHG